MMMVMMMIRYKDHASVCDWPAPQVSHPPPGLITSYSYRGGKTQANAMKHVMEAVDHSIWRSLTVLHDAHVQLRFWGDSWHGRGIFLTSLSIP